MTVNLLLVRPPARWRRPPSLIPPLGLMYVAGAARAAGYGVDILDAQARGIDWADLADACRQHRPDVIGLTSFSPLADETRRACQLLRPVTGAIVVGGPHVSAGGGDIPGDLPVDAITVGEAENSIGPLLAWLAAGAQGAPPAGVAVPGRPFKPRHREKNLDRLPFPARDLLDHRRYRYPLATRAGVTAMLTGRGCPNRCVFCDKAVTGSLPRLHSPGRVVAEMEEIIQRGQRFAVIFDDEFTADGDRVAHLCESILSAGLDLHWKCEARADSVDLPLLQLMRRAGCRMVAFGVESSSAESLKFLRKGLDPHRSWQALRDCRQAGLDTLAYLLVGIPGETPRDVRRTVRLCKRAGASWIQLSTLSPYPGTDLHRLAVDNGWLQDTSIRNAADAEINRPTLVAPPWNQAGLQRALVQGHASFYLRPRWLARTAIASCRPGRLQQRLPAAVQLGRWFLGHK